MKSPFALPVRVDSEPNYPDRYRILSAINQILAENLELRTAEFIEAAINNFPPDSPAAK
jgi:hypothetical protein